MDKQFGITYVLLWELSLKPISFNFHLYGIRAIYYKAVWKASFLFSSLSPLYIYIYIYTKSEAIDLGLDLSNLL